MTHFNQCRFCKRCGWNEGVIGPLMQYAVRHYICAQCFLDKKWEFSRLTYWQLSQFPALLAHKHGRYAELGKAIQAYDDAEKAVQA